jgi:hypothetical protein
MSTGVNSSHFSNEEAKTQRKKCCDFQNNQVDLVCEDGGTALGSGQCMVLSV